MFYFSEKSLFFVLSASFFAPSAVRGTPKPRYGAKTKPRQAALSRGGENFFQVSRGLPTCANKKKIFGKRKIFVGPPAKYGPATFQPDKKFSRPLDSIAAPPWYNKSAVAGGGPTGGRGAGPFSIQPPNPPPIGAGRRTASPFFALSL